MSDDNSKDPLPPMDRLEQQARVERFPRMGDQPVDGKTAYVARDNIANWMRQWQVSNTELARMAGVSNEAMSNVLRAKGYKSDHADILRKAEAAISEWYNRRTMPGTTRFVMTAIARQIFAVVKLTSRSRGIGVVTAPSGCGKSMALEAVRRQDLQNAILVTVNAGCCSPHGFLQAVIQAERMSAVRVPAKRPYPSGFAVGSIADSFNRLTETLANSGRVVLIDEADGLKAETFGVVRELHDSAGNLPIVLVGRPPLHNRISNTMRDESIGGSLVGRICVEHAIKPEAGAGGDPSGRWLFSVEEVMAMLSQYKVKYTPDAARWLCALANVSAIEGQREGGALRFAVKVLEMAITVNPGEEITVALLRQANTLLRGWEWGNRADQVIEKFATKVVAAG